MFRLSALVALLSLTTTAQTLDEIVKLAIAARGGAEKLHAMQTQRLRGRITSGADTGSLLVEIQRPASIREEFMFGKETVVRVSDGTNAWLTIGKKPATPLDANSIKNLSNSADLEGPLMDYVEKGHKIELAAPVDIAGRKHYKLLVHQKDGVERVDYIDAKTFLESKWEGKINNRGQDFSVESYFSDYRTVDGIAIAFRIESTTVGVDEKQIIVIENADVNLVFDRDHFKKPVK